MTRNLAKRLKAAAQRALLRGLLVSGLLLAAALPSLAADPNPGNDSDSLTVSILPQSDFGVTIDTAEVTLDFIMAPGDTAYTLKPATVTIVGNVHPQELNVSAANITAAPVWTLDTDEVAQADELRMYALFAEGRQSPPSAAEFSGAKNLITGSAKRAGFESSSGPDGNFENSSMTGAANMDNILLTQPARQLWLRLDAPPFTSTEDEQSVQITITATRTNL